MIPFPYQYAVAALLAALIGWLGLSKFNSYVDEKVNEKYTEKVKTFQAEILDKVNKIEEVSTTLAKSREEDQKITSERLDEILLAAQKKGFVTVTKEGKCTPSKNFLDTYNSVIDEANRK